jgi:hypothetical protein
MVPSVRPWLIAGSLPSCEAAKTSMFQRPEVRLAISRAAQSASVC